MNVIARDKVSKQSQPACGGLFLTFLDCFVPPEADRGGLLAKTTEGTFSTAPLSLFKCEIAVNDFSPTQTNWGLGRVFGINCESADG
jgi:hypothetical protein